MSPYKSTKLGRTYGSVKSPLYSTTTSTGRTLPRRGSAVMAGTARLLAALAAIAGASGFIPQAALAWPAAAGVPRSASRGTPAGTRALRGAGLSEGEAVTVVGAASPVGRRLAAALLADGRFRVRLVASSAAGLERFQGSAAECYLGNVAQDVHSAAQDLDLLVVSGAPAPAGSIRRAAEVLRDSSAVVLAESTTCFPSVRWLYGLRPENLDGRGGCACSVQPPGHATAAVCAAA